MSIICLIFGHKPPSYAGASGAEYAFISDRGKDGIERLHGDVYGDCPRCGGFYRVCKVHQHAGDWTLTKEGWQKAFKRMRITP